MNELKLFIKRLYHASSFKTSYIIKGLIYSFNPFIPLGSYYFIKSFCFDYSCYRYVLTPSRHGQLIKAYYGLEV